MHAVDDDYGVNGTVTYSSSDLPSLFDLNTKSGKITLKNSIEKNEDVMEFCVTANDGVSEEKEGRERGYGLIIGHSSPLNEYRSHSRSRRFDETSIHKERMEGKNEERSDEGRRSHYCRRKK